MREKLFKCIGREDLIEDHRVHLICDKHFSEKQKFIFRSMNRTNLNADLVPDTSRYTFVFCLQRNVLVIKLFL